MIKFGKKMVEGKTREAKKNIEEVLSRISFQNLEKKVTQICGNVCSIDSKTIKSFIENLLEEVAKNPMEYEKISEGKIEEFVSSLNDKVSQDQKTQLEADLKEGIKNELAPKEIPIDSEIEEFVEGFVKTNKDQIQNFLQAPGSRDKCDKLGRFLEGIYKSLIEGRYLVKINIKGTDHILSEKQIIKSLELLWENYSSVIEIIFENTDYRKNDLEYLEEKIPIAKEVNINAKKCLPMLKKIYNLIIGQFIEPFKIEEIEYFKIFLGKQLRENNLDKQTIETILQELNKDLKELLSITEKAEKEQKENGRVSPETAQAFRNKIKEAIKNFANATYGTLQLLGTLTGTGFLLWFALIGFFFPLWLIAKMDETVGKYVGQFKLV